jgi:hypothetical protein
VTPPTFQTNPSLTIQAQDGAPGATGVSNEELAQPDGFIVDTDEDDFSDSLLTSR